MESLLRISGLLSDEDAGKTDLGTLEKRLAERVSTSGDPSRRESSRQSVSSPTNALSDSHHSTPQQDMHSSPRHSVTTSTSDADKERNEEVENLSDLMCSLVTNNCGETRYIGELVFRIPHMRGGRLTVAEGRRPDSPYSRPKAFNGSMKRLETTRFKK